MFRHTLHILVEELLSHRVSSRIHQIPIPSRRDRLSGRELGYALDGTNASRPVLQAECRDAKSLDRACHTYAATRLTCDERDFFLERHLRDERLRVLERARPGIASRCISYSRYLRQIDVLNRKRRPHVRGGHAAAVLLESVGRNALEF